MPYRDNSELPFSLRRVLPSHAQDIYRAAFNNAWANHAAARDFGEATAHRMAWAAVKRRYHKENGLWVANSAPAPAGWDGNTQ